MELASQETLFKIRKYAIEIQQSSKDEMDIDEEGPTSWENRLDIDLQEMQRLVEKQKLRLSKVMQPVPARFYAERLTVASSQSRQ
jgi:hypothetical protein